MHSIKQFCDKIDSIKLMADDLRKTPPSDPNLKNKIEVIQSDCLLVAKGKVDKEFYINKDDLHKWKSQPNLEFYNSQLIYHIIS